jgi:membrane associated rhomboid family serine protease
MSMPSKRRKVTLEGLLQVWMLFVAIALTAGAIAVALGAVSVPPAQGRNITIFAVMSCIVVIAGLVKRDDH